MALGNVAYVTFGAQSASRMDEMSPPQKPQSRESLSARQMQSLALVAKGLTSKEIGRELGLSPSTVDNHIRAAIDRLGAKNRAEAAGMIGAGGFDKGGPMPHAGIAHETAASDNFAWWKLPPIGGVANTLTKRQRLYRILQIGVFALTAVSGAILTIAGVVHILSAG